MPERDADSWKSWKGSKVLEERDRFGELSLGTHGLQAGKPAMSFVCAIDVTSFTASFARLIFMVFKISTNRQLEYDLRAPPTP